MCTHNLSWYNYFICNNNNSKSDSRLAEKYRGTQLMGCGRLVGKQQHKFTKFKLIGSIDNCTMKQNMTSKHTSEDENFVRCVVYP